MSLETEEKAVLGIGCVAFVMGVAFYGAIIAAIIFAILKFLV